MMDVHQVSFLKRENIHEGLKETLERPENNPDWENHLWLYRYHAGVASHKIKIPK